jgi:hypothetical protein
MHLGIRNNLLGLTEISQLEKLNQFGMIVENAIVERLNSILQSSAPDARRHYWWTKTKEEVDIVIHFPGRLLSIEVKIEYLYFLLPR